MELHAILPVCFLRTLAVIDLKMLKNIDFDSHHSKWNDAR